MVPSPNSPITREVIHRGRKFDFEVVEIVTPGGKRLRREVVRHPGAMVVLPILPDGRVALIRAFRPSLEREILELPAGTLEPGEAPEACAGRELEEETGYRAAEIRPLGRFFTSPGLSDELMHAYFATELTFHGQRLEDDERLSVEPRSLGETLALIESGEFMDAKSIVTILLAMRGGLLGSV